MMDHTPVKIDIDYRNQDGWHLFTSGQVPGLFVASPDLKTAFDDVPKVLFMLMKLDHGIDCVVLPKLDYDEFLQIKRTQMKTTLYLQILC